MASEITHQNKEEVQDYKFGQIEYLKEPYKFAMKGNWKGVEDYYRENPKELDWPMKLDGENVLHLAASSFSKSQCREVLETFMNLCSDSTPEDKRRYLRVPNKDGNNALHQVSVSGSVEAAKFLVRYFNGPVADASSFAHEAAEFLISDFNGPVSDATSPETVSILKEYSTDEKYNDVLPLMWTRNHLGETPLYKAAALGHTDLVKFYVQTLKAQEEYAERIWPQFNRRDKMGILRMAVIGQHFETAHWLLKKYPNLGQMVDEDGLTGLQLLAQMPTVFEPHFQQSPWNMFIYHCLPDGEPVDDVGSSRDMDSTHQESDVESGRYMDSSHQEGEVESGRDMDSTHQEGDVESGKSIFRKKLAVVMKAYYSLLDSLEGTRDSRGGIIYKIWKDKKNKKSLKKLIKLLVKYDYTWLSDDKQPNIKPISLGKHPNKVGDDSGGKGNAAEEDTKPGKTNAEDRGDKKKEATKLKKEARDEVYSSTPLLIATVTGNVHIVEEIFDQHPQAIEHVNIYERNILHLAIKNRQKKIFDLIKTDPNVMSKLNRRIDKYGNTILHQAADRSYYSISLSQKLIGPAMQLQAELRWFQLVKEIVPPQYTIHHNDKDQTAQELFNFWHDDLLEEAQKWAKETAQSCSTVAVLVATVVFAAAYAIPGGTSDKNGLPLFQNDPLFLLFTSMDVVAISSSLSSVAFFLSIISSPLEYPLFVSSIPNKIMAGFVLLFISMATTMLAFASTILLLVRVEKKWTKSLLYPIAFFPVPLFGLLQFPMYQSFNVIFQKINSWFFKNPLRFLGFLKKRSMWSKTK